MLFAPIFIAVMALFGASSAQWTENMWDNRNTIVHLFEWKFSDIADECERFLQEKGYGGVQVIAKSSIKLHKFSEIEKLYSRLHQLMKML